MERIKEDRPITIKDDKGNLNRCIADVVSVGPGRIRRGGSSPGRLESHCGLSDHAALGTSSSLALHHGHGQAALGDPCHG